MRLFALLLVLVPSLVQAQVGDGRLYVNRIVFLGTDQIDDHVLRRELLQLEGTHIDTAALEQSRQRLERLPYVERAQVAQVPVKGASDQVDLHITISEAPAREYRVGGAFSESARLSGFGYLVNENVLGTGQRLFARVGGSEIRRAVQVS
ncbi:MAG: hypothetical protein OER91_14105, partial [Gammaproteobacteria bacterium]|nr:hypothetical protein [Gammaproteobacteria bacterium]